MLFGRLRRAQGPPDEADRFATEALDLLDSLYGAAVRLTRNPDTAQDLVQDTYLKAFRARHRFEPGSNLKAWLFTILQNTWRNRRRDQARSRVEFDSEAAESAAASAAPSPVRLSDSPETLLLRDTLDADLRDALAGLPEAYREAVWLRDVEELSYSEIATVLGIPAGTVMSRISRGRRQLHDALVSRRAAAAAKA
jgi:RNA polymerase sigma-70 factor (ECF subfamily)